MTATAPTASEIAGLKLPADLDGYRPEIYNALKYPQLSTWDEEQESAYADAPEVQQIAGTLIRAIHHDLGPAKIVYLFKKEMKTRDRIVLGKASKASGKLKHLVEGLDFVIEINWTTWKLLPPIAKLALVDHELLHCAREEEKYLLLHHDVEAFTAEVRRWGLWKADLKDFGKAVQQLELTFEAPGQAQAMDRLMDGVVEGFKGLDMPEGCESMELHVAGRAPVKVERNGKKS